MTLKERFPTPITSIHEAGPRLLEILDFGWQKGRYGNEAKTQCCVLGAVRVAVTLNAYGWTSELTSQMLLMLTKNLPMGFCTVAELNDDPKTTLEDVKNLVRKSFNVES